MEPQTKSCEGNMLKTKENNKNVFLWAALYPLGSSCPTFLPCKSQAPWWAARTLAASGSIWQPLVWLIILRSL